jgi:hypothetical protein
VSEPFFSSVIKKIEANLNFNEFKKVQNNNELSAVFSNNNTLYEISYDKSEKKFILKFTDATDQNTDQDWHVISKWFFDPSSDGERQLQSIAADFIETMGSCVKLPDKKPKKTQKEEEKNVNPLFFANRLATIFPKLKDDMKAEKKHHPNLRTVGFFRENVVPKINELLNQSTDQKTIKKLATLLETSYKSGDLDVRAVITMIILNSIENQAPQNALRDKINDDLKKAWDAATKVRNKRVRPEKVKKGYSAH